MNSSLPRDTCAAEKAALMSTRSTEALNPTIRSALWRCVAFPGAAIWSTQPSPRAVRAGWRTLLAARMFGSLASHPQDMLNGRCRRWTGLDGTPA